MLPPRPLAVTAVGIGVGPVASVMPRPAGAAGAVAAGTATGDCAGAAVHGRAVGVVAEEVLEAMAPLLEADEGQAELRDRVADEVVRPLVDQVDQDGRSIDDRVEPGRGEPLGQGSWPSSTSTASVPVRSVKEPSGAERSSFPPSIATR